MRNGLLGMMVIALVVAPSLAAAGEPLANFITRRGDQLYDGDKVWRFQGANMPGLVLPYDYTLDIPERMVLPTAWEQEDGFKTLDQMNLRAVRTWSLPIRAPQRTAPSKAYVLGPGEFNEDAFVVLDRALALANRYQVRMIIALTAEAGDYLGGIGTYAAHRQKPRAAFYTDSQVKDDFKATIRHLLTRRNTVTGQIYKDDKAVLAWEFGNELRTAPRDWQSEMAAYMKSLDTNHLVMDGRDNLIPPEPDENIDIYTRHYYGGDWVKNTREDCAKLKGKRPLIIGEYGLTDDVKMTGEFLAEVEKSGVSGALIWSMYFHHRDGGFWWHQIHTHPSLWSYHWPGFDSGEPHKERALMQLLRASAFRIRGETAPPLPTPAPPELLPFTGTPLFSWRGSAGASGYIVMRAKAADGPWETLAEGYSDAEVAYRPLFADESARPGETWFYRVAAENGMACSLPSNVVGPVNIERGCVIDELKSLDKAVKKSDELSVVNTQNALYAEFMYRAKGEAGQWLVYRAPGDVKSIVVYAWPDQGADPLKFEVSADGEAFKAVDAKTAKRSFRPFKNRTPVEVRYDAAPPAGQRYVKLLWQSDCELDRVEIYY